MEEIQQGARSEVRLITVDGIRCVEKRYNHQTDPAAVKQDHERAFYEHYSGLG